MYYGIVQHITAGEDVGSLQRHHLHFDLNNMNSTDTMLQVDSIEQRGRQTRMNIISMSISITIKVLEQACVHSVKLSGMGQTADSQADDATDHSLLKSIHWGRTLRDHGPEMHPRLRDVVQPRHAWCV